MSVIRLYVFAPNKPEAMQANHRSRRWLARNDSVLRQVIPGWGLVSPWEAIGCYARPGLHWIPSTMPTLRRPADSAPRLFSAPRGDAASAARLRQTEPSCGRLSPAAAEGRAAELARMHARGGFEELRRRVGDVVEHVDLALELRGELAWGDIAEI